MNVQQEIRHHLGEREFLDYPVFLEAGVAERHAVLRRALLAALGALAVGAAVVGTVIALS
jgi:hypothetical protein